MTSVAYVANFIVVWRVFDTDSKSHWFYVVRQENKQVATVTVARARIAVVQSYSSFEFTDKNKFARFSSPPTLRPAGELAVLPSKQLLDSERRKDAEGKDGGMGRAKTGRPVHMSVCSCLCLTENTVSSPSFSFNPLMHKVPRSPWRQN